MSRYVFVRSCGSGFYQDVTMHGNDVSQWYPDLPLQHYPRRDTPVPDVEMEGAPYAEDHALWKVRFPLLDAQEEPCPPASVHHWLRKSPQPRQHRPLQPVERFTPRKPREGPPMMMGHVPFAVETLEDRMATSPFSAVRTERDRFMEMMSGPPPPAIFDPQPRPGMAAMPQPHARKLPSHAGGLFGEDGVYDEFSSALPAGKEWGGNCKEAEAALAGQRLRQPRRSRAPGPNREPDLGGYFARQNNLYDFGCTPVEVAHERSQGRLSVMRERLRRLEHRHSPLEDNREQVPSSITDRCTSVAHMV